MDWRSFEELVQHFYQELLNIDVVLREYLLQEGIRENEINTYLEFGSEIVISKTNGGKLKGIINHSRKKD